MAETMNLYVLKRRGPSNYDEYAGFVVRAASEERARAMTQVYSVEEDDDMAGIPRSGAAEFLGEDGASCVVLACDVAGAESLILADFRAG